MFVLSISAWFLLKKREESFAKRSILVSGIFGLLSSLMVAYTGDASARIMAKDQPMKFAAMEALYEGKSNAGLVAVGILKNSNKKIGDLQVKEFAFKIEIPGLLSVLTGGNRDAYVPGIVDQLYGNPSKGIISVPEKIEKGKFASGLLNDYKRARMMGDNTQIETVRGIFNKKEFQTEYFRYFGYASINIPELVVPSVTMSFYSFHFMVILGFIFIIIFSIAVYLLFKGSLTQNRWFLVIAFLSLPLPYLAGEMGWMLTEIGRQPWIIQDLMTVNSAVSKISSGTVITTFILFAVLFTVLFISEISIMIKQVKTGPKH
jgi:cytochrome d ubiquinol oxidase subunit I